MTDDAVPTGWQQPAEPDDEMTRYNPQPVTQYEHATTDVGVQLTPIEPHTESASDDGYRISVLSAHTNDLDEVASLATTSDHSAALNVAREFMRVYNERCIDGDAPLDTVVREFSEVN
jgi:hypothetical protein